LLTGPYEGPLKRKLKRGARTGGGRKTWAYFAAIAPAFAAHGEISVSKYGRSAMTGENVTAAVTMPGAQKTPSVAAQMAIVTILVESEHFEFDSNSRRNRVKFGQKLRFIAKDSFKPPC
jgi:hypothetical protein